MGLFLQVQTTRRKRTNINRKGWLLAFAVGPLMLAAFTYTVVVRGNDAETAFSVQSSLTIAPLSEWPYYVSAAVIAVEDRRFFNHSGVDWLGIARAAIKNTHAGRVVQGGSTLTQQLIKNLCLTPERTVSRKLRELVYALELEKSLQKQEILALYLKTVYFGAGAYGIENAARTYFGKRSRSLELHEAALLVGLLKSPSVYNPLKHRDRAIRRMRKVLSDMVSLGALNESEAQAAFQAPLEFKMQSGVIAAELSRKPWAEDRSCPLAWHRSSSAAWHDWSSLI